MKQDCFTSHEGAASAATQQAKPLSQNYILNSNFSSNQIPGFLDSLLVSILEKCTLLSAKSLDLASGIKVVLFCHVKVNEGILQCIKPVSIYF